MILSFPVGGPSVPVPRLLPPHRLLAKLPNGWALVRWSEPPAGDEPASAWIRWRPAGRPAAGEARP